MARREADPKELRQLTAHFRALGASRPEAKAKSQLEEGIPQYARFVFLRQAWGKSVIADGDTSWVDRYIENSERDPKAPGAGAGPALRRLLAAGPDREDIAEVVRVMQWEVLSGLAYLLQDAGRLSTPPRSCRA